MTDPLKLQHYQARYVGQLLEATAKAIEGLTEEQLHSARTAPATRSASMRGTSRARQTTSSTSPSTARCRSGCSKV